MKKVVIIGGGFAGLTLARKISKKLFSVTVVDRNNYYQFQPLLYQVAISGIDAESICFPLRGVFSKQEVMFHMGEVVRIERDLHQVVTSTGTLEYDYLVIAAGAKTNYFNNTRISENSLPMKSAEDALRLRSRILENLEAATREKDAIRRTALLNIAVVGGGATGVEVAGALAEMKNYVIPRDFPELVGEHTTIQLIEGSGRLLSAMSERSSAYALRSLQKMGVGVMLNTLVTDYDGHVATLNCGETLNTELLVWVSGVTAERFEGIPIEAIGPGGRIITNAYSSLEADDSIFALGDIAIEHRGDSFVKNPQVAPVAIQQANLLAKNLAAIEQGIEPQPFLYKNPGIMATIGRNKAVAEIGAVRLQGFVAWSAWLVIHLRSILGVRNKIVILIDWVWNYFSYFKSTGLIMFK